MTEHVEIKLFGELDDATKGKMLVDLLYNGVKFEMHTKLGTWEDRPYNESTFCEDVAYRYFIKPESVTMYGWAIECDDGWIAEASVNQSRSDMFSITFDIDRDNKPIAGTWKLQEMK